MKKRRPQPNHTVAAASARAHALIEAMLQQMQQAMADPVLLESPEWERLFGAKQSMVVNVQKLVQALAAIPPAESEESKTQMSDQEEQSLSLQEMELLKGWLAETTLPAD